MSEEKPGFMTGATPEEYTKAIAGYVEGLADADFAYANYNNRTFVNENPNHSILSDYSRNDYEYYRPSERIPKDDRKIIEMCMNAYDANSIVYNVLNIMSDFACQGVRIQHKVKATERFLNTWFDHVKGRRVSERFCNLLLRAGQAPVWTSYGNVSKKSEREMRAKADDISVTKQKVYKRNVPLKYTFLNPTALEVVGGEFAHFTGELKYGLRVTPKIQLNFDNIHRSMHNNQSVQKMMDGIPADIIKGLQDKNKVVPLDAQKFHIYHYKKDDWKVWAYPITYPILNQLIAYEKMQLADMAAVDGARSSVRLWNIGYIDSANPQNSILPNKALLNRFRNQIANNVGGGTVDFVVGPEVTFKESDSKSYQFLGSEKYEVVLNAIFDGLGIPPVLRSNKNATGTNSFISLRTLIERLEYIRSVLVEFWNAQLAIVMEAFGLSGKANVVFNQMILGDEAAEKKLWIELNDRNIISDESLRERFSIDNDIEETRVRKEDNRRGQLLMKKAGPYFNPEPENDYKKIALQAGDITISQLDVELEEREEGETPRVDKLAETQMQIAKERQVAKPNDGRPPNRTETTKRKPKPNTTIQTKANVQIWADYAQDQIHDMVIGSLVKAYGKTNMRQLSKSEVSEVEYLKFKILCSLTAFDDITPETVYKGLDSSNAINAEVLQTISSLKQDFLERSGREPNLYDLRKIQSAVYAIWSE